MSPARSSRSSALCFALVLIVVDTKVKGFAIRSAYNASNGRPQDLAVEESLQLEVKHDFKRPNGVNINRTVKHNEFSTTTSNVDLITTSYPQIETTVDVEVFTNTVTNNGTFYEQQARRSDSAVRNNVTTLASSFAINSSLYEESSKILKERVLRAQLKPITKNITSNLKPKSKEFPDLENTPLSIKSDKTLYIKPTSGSYLEKGTVFNDLVTAAPFTQPGKSISTPTKEYQNMRVMELASYTTDNTNSYDFLTTKKYTVIDIKGIDTTENNPSTTYVYEPVNKAVTRTVSEESIMKAAKDWILATKTMQGLEYSPTTTNPYTETTQYQEVLAAAIGLPKPKPELEFVSSKRAGFLNLSLKSKETETTTENDAVGTSSRNEYTTATEDNNEEDHTSDNLSRLLGSQRYLDEDAIKEELLQEISLKNNQEIASQIREERFNSSATTISSAEQYVTDSTHGAELVTQTDPPNTESTFNIKSVQDKGEFKNAGIYTVSPNYKPMKKIEILPPKPFVRDPDDNSWRNESISSLGIVFKPKNSSKPFTQVLKNKTETEWSNTSGRENKSDVPGLRERLEKIARKRKTKKKKTDLFGELIYSDYEESNSSEEITSTQDTAYTSTATSPSEDETTVTTVVTEVITEASTPGASTPGNVSVVTTTDTVTENNTNTTPALSVLPVATNNITLNMTKEKVHKKVKYDSSLIEKGKKYFNIFDYYDVSDEDESEYMELAKLELKKFAAPVYVTDAPFITQPPVTPYQFSSPLTEYVPEKKSTLQYFPPRNTQQPKTNRFDNEFEKKFKNYVKLTSPKHPTSPSLVNSPDTPLGKYHSRIPQEPNHYNNHHHTSMPDLQTIYKPNVYANHHYHAEHPQVTTAPISTHATAHADHEGYNRGSHFVKNYKDFLSQAAKDYDYDRDAGLLPFTRSPQPALAFSDLVAQEKDKMKPTANFNYDYDSNFRKEVLQRFVDNFNRNEMRYKDNFQVLYNNTVMHVNAGGGADAFASSRAFMKGLYKPADTRLGYARREPYDPHCDNVTVELSPAYELHYYVPEQEENEEMEAKAAAAGR